MTEDLETLRRELETVLPASIRAAIGAYGRFTADEPPPDAKGFAAWHAAAKAALGHIDLLVKLARWAEGKGDEPGPNDGIDRLLAEARAALSGFEEDEP